VTARERGRPLSADGESRWSVVRNYDYGPEFFEGSAIQKQAV